MIPTEPIGSLPTPPALIEGLERAVVAGTSLAAGALGIE